MTDVEEATPDDGDLARVRGLGARMVVLQKKIDELTTQLTEQSQILRVISDQELPNALMEIGLQGFTLDTGHIIGIQTIVRASIPKAKRDDAFAWLRLNGHGDLIKNEVSVAFSRGQDNMASDLAGEIRHRFPEQKVEESVGVHAGTLTAFVKEQELQGVDLPADLLGIFRQRTATITNPKPTL